jgi:hypothetical protein
MNLVDFSLLSDVLAPLTVPDLLSTVVVSWVVMSDEPPQIDTGR